jgi:hypothetical protein
MCQFARMRCRLACGEDISCLDREGASRFRNLLRETRSGFTKLGTTTAAKLSGFQVSWTELNGNLCRTKHLAKRRVFQV